MELFEILFILFFILIPIINGISKRRQRRGESEDIQLPGDARERPRMEPREEPPEPAEAADMVPDDLWEILTGERRERGATPRPTERPTEPEPEPEWEPVGPSEEWTPESPWQAEEQPREQERFEPAPWIEDSPLDRRVELPAQQEPAPRVAQYGREDRGARRIRIAAQDALAAPRPRGVSPLIRALRRPDGLRQAMVLRDILGPPKGLPS